MEMSLPCPSCGASVEKPADLLAQKTACPECGHLIFFAEMATLAGVAPPPAASPSSLAGTRLGGYRLLRLIGRGGMGEVYEAIQESLDRRVAIKVLPKHLTTDISFVKRFQRESGALAQLSHPHIVSIYDRGQQEGIYYFALEYVEGEKGRPAPTLQHLVTGPTPLDLPNVVRLIAQVADALAYAHATGLVHRDVKPLNVLLDRRGNARLVDFGLAHLVGLDNADQEQLTQAGDVLGTAAYLSPEQRRGGEVDARTDVYSCGVMLYQMLTGHLPQGAFEGPSQVNPALGPEWDTLTTKALQRDPERRFGSMSEFAEALHAAAGTAAPGSAVRLEVDDDRTRLLRDTESKLRSGRFRQALEQLEPALQIHPGDEALTSLRERAETGRERLVHLTQEEIPKLWGDRHYSGMLRRLEQLDALRPGFEGLEEARTEAAAAVNHAMTETAVADQLLSGGNPREALARYESAITHCADFGPALSGMEAARAVAPRPSGRATLYLTVAILLGGAAGGFAVVRAYSPESLGFLSPAKSSPAPRAAAAAPPSTPAAPPVNPYSVFVDAAAKQPPGSLLTSFRRLTQPVTSAAVSPDGTVLVAGGSGGEMKMWDLPSGRELPQIRGHDDYVKAIEFSRDGSRILSCGADKVLKVWVTATGQEAQHSPAQGKKALRATFAADGNRVLSVGSDATLRIWDLNQHSEQTVAPLEDLITSAAFSPDAGKLLVASFSRFGAVALWNAKTGRKIRTLEGEPVAVWATAFSPDSRYAATGDAAHTVRLWDISAGREVQAFHGHAQWVESVAFSPDGRFILSGGDDGTVCLWDCTSTKLVLTLPGTGSPVLTVGFTPDGRFAFSGAEDRSLQLWKLWSGTMTGPER